MTGIRAGWCAACNRPRRRLDQMRRPPAPTGTTRSGLPGPAPRRSPGRARACASSCTTTPPIARSRNRASPSRVSHRARQAAPGTAPSGPGPPSDAPTSSSLDRTDLGEPPARRRSPCPSPPAATRRPRAGRPRAAPTARDRRAEPVIVLDRHATPAPRTAGPVRSATPTRPSGRRGSARPAARASRRGHWFSHCARNDCDRIRLIRVVAFPVDHRLVALARSAARAAASSAATPAATPSRPRGPRSRGADHSISRSPVTALERRPARPAGGRASAPSPAGAPSRPAAAAAARARPSSASTPHRSLEARTFHASSAAAATHAVAVHRLLGAEHPPRPVRQPARSPPGR